MNVFIEHLGDFCKLVLGGVFGASISGIVTHITNKTNRRNSMLKSDFDDLKKIDLLISSLLYLHSEGYESEKYTDARGSINYRNTAEFQQLLQRLNEELGVNKYFRDDMHGYYKRLDVPAKIEELRGKVEEKVSDVERQLKK